MARKKKHPEHVNHERWLISYADFITLLFAFFVVMFAVSQVDSNKVGRFTESVRAVTMWNGPPLAPARQESHAKNAQESIMPTNVVVTGHSTGVDLRQIRDLLRQKLRSAIVNSRISIEVEHGNLVVRLQDVGFFETGSATLTAESVEDLRTLGDAVLELKYPIRIEGHTDSIRVRSPRFRSNWDLSTARAVAVVDVLHDLAGVPEKRLSVAGYADTRPVDTNFTPEGRRHNRRVDIVLTELNPNEPVEELRRASSEDAAPAPPAVALDSTQASTAAPGAAPQPELPVVTQLRSTPPIH